MEERIYTIGLKKDTRPRRYKSKRAINDIRDFAVRHMGDQGSTVANVKIDSEVADKIWERGAANPPEKIRVKIKKEAGKITVETLDKGKKETEKLLGEKPKEAPTGEKKAEQKPNTEAAKPNLGSAK